MRLCVLHELESTNVMSSETTKAKELADTGRDPSAQNATGVGPAAQASIGQMLRSYYASLVEEPLPASLLELRRALEKREDEERE